MHITLLYTLLCNCNTSKSKSLSFIEDLWRLQIVLYIHYGAQALTAWQRLWAAELLCCVYGARNETKLWPNSSHFLLSTPHGPVGLGQPAPLLCGTLAVCLLTPPQVFPIADSYALHTHTLKSNIVLSVRSVGPLQQALTGPEAYVYLYALNHTELSTLHRHKGRHMVLTLLRLFRGRKEPCLVLWQLKWVRLKMQTEHFYGLSVIYLWRKFFFSRNCFITVKVAVEWVSVNRMGCSTS